MIVPVDSDLVVPFIALALGVFGILGFTIWSHPND